MLKGNQAQGRRPSPLGVASTVFLIGGLLAWLWLGDWRWAVTGLGLWIGTVAVATAFGK